MQIYIQNTLKRIVPLEHKIYLNKDKIFLVRNAKDVVNEDEVNKAMDTLKTLNTKEKDNKMTGKDKDKKFETEKKKMKSINQIFFTSMAKNQNPINRITVSRIFVNA